MKILLVYPFVPYPLDSGGAQAVFSMVEHLRKSCSVSMLFRAGHYKDLDALKHIWPDVDFYVYARQRGSRSWLPMSARFLSYLSNSFTRKYNRFFFRYWPWNRCMDRMLRVRTLNNLKPVDLDYGYCEFVKSVAQKGFDLIQVEFNEHLGLCYFLPDNAIKVFVHHEIGFVRRENELSLLPSASLADKAHFEQEKDREISMLRRYDYVITLTATDKRILSGYLSPEKIYVSPAVVSRHDSEPFRKCGKEFVFIGGSDHFPNYDGMNWLCECVLPLLRKKMTGFRIYVVGNWSGNARRTIARKNKEIEFTGYVKDIQKFLNGKISIIPIRIGSGMRMKILDAVWSNSPFITTDKGVEGQSFIDGKDCMIARTPEKFADAMLTLSGDESMQKMLSGNAQQTVRETYDPDAMIRNRMDFYAALSMKQEADKIHPDVEAAVCACARTEEKYIREWIDYHLDLGFSRIIICDNNDKGDNTLNDTLADYVSAGKVEILDYRGAVNFQVKAYNACLKKYRRKYSWIAFIDVDEFITFAGHDICRNIRDYLQEASAHNADAVYLNWQLYGDNGKLHYEQGSIIERFPEPASIGKVTNEHIKSIVSTVARVKFKNPHNIVRTVFSLKRPLVVNDCMEPLRKNSPRQDISYRRVYIRHYITKTIEEYIMQKYYRGAADCRRKKKYSIYTLDRFYQFNERTSEKEAIIQKMLGVRKSDIM